MSHNFQILEIARELPEWFTKEAIIQIEKDLRNYSVLVDDENLVNGFIIYYFENNKCFIKWMATRKNNQRKGVGKKLVDSLADLCKKEKIKLIETDTLAETEDYPPYEKTRKFYHAVGFEDVEVVKKGYPEGSDKLILRKDLK